jgi:small subunit ribosomal protein S20
VANLKSSKKDIRRIEKRTELNKAYRDNMKSAVKTVRMTITNKDVTPEGLKAAQKALDKAAKRGVIKKQTASRLKSRIMIAANKASAK